MDATIDLKLFATLAAYTPHEASRYRITSGMTVAHLIELLQIPLVSAKLIFVNGIRVDLETRLNGGERVGIFPPVGGG
jgi:sulfur-carrier protein